MTDAGKALPPLNWYAISRIGGRSARWFMTAHSLQQAANDAARAAVAGLDTTERRALVDQSIAASRAAFPAPAAQTIGIGTEESGGYYRVTLSYSLSNAPIFAATPIPLAATTLQRSAVVRIAVP